MANCLMKLQTFNLWKHLSTLRACTNGTSWRDWIPNNFFNPANLIFLSTFFFLKLEITQYNNLVIPARVDDHVTLITPREFPKLHSSRR